jgi:hypothetical protein
MEQDKRYIVIRDNIWEIIKKFDLLGEIFFEIHTRTTIDFIKKNDCYVKYGSSLLYYDGNIKVNNSNIEVESEEEFEKYLMERSKDNYDDET